MLAEDRDAARASTADIDEPTARRQVINLVENGIISPAADQGLLVHGPSGAAFASIRQLAVYHAGWTAAQTADENS